MIPALLSPAGLFALAALALPLLLHLARREERHPVDFAALRWLSARARPRRRLRFEDLLLLALRLLLLALLALLLARPVLPARDAGATWIVAAPGVGEGALREAVPVAGGAPGAPGAPDPLRTGDGGDPAAPLQRRWLLPGFPAPEATPAPAPAAATTASGSTTLSLLRELDMRLPAGTALVVLVPPLLEGVDAERPRLSRPVEWRVVPAGDRPTSGDVRDGATFDARDAPAAAPAPPPRLVIRHAGTGSGARYLRAASAAWQAPPSTPMTGPEVRAWLAAGPLPAGEQAWIEAGGSAVLAHDTVLAGLDEAPVLWHDDRSNPLLRATPLGRGRVLQWTRALEPGHMPALLEADFADRLRAALQPPPPPSRVLASGHAPRVGGVGPWPQARRELAPGLALAITLLFLLERWLATGSRRERQP